MPEHNDQFKDAISNLANALQTAAPLATRRRRVLGDLVQNAQRLEAAVEYAVPAVLGIQPDGRKTGGAR